MEKSMEVPQKIKNRTTKWSNNSTSGHLYEGTKDTNLKRYLHFHIHCNIICNSKDMETIQVSTDGWMDKQYNIYI